MVAGLLWRHRLNDKVKTGSVRKDGRNLRFSEIQRMGSGKSLCNKAYGGGEPCCFPKGSWTGGDERNFRGLRFGKTGGSFLSEACWVRAESLAKALGLGQSH